jgi:hypothetical protein
MRGVQRPPIAGQLLGVIVNRVDQVARRFMRLGVEDQVVTKLPHLLKICGDGGGPRFLAPPPLFFPLVCLRGGSVFGFGHATSKRPRHRDANYQSVAAGNVVEPPVVAGVEKSVSEQGAESMPRLALSAIHDVSECVHGQHNHGHDADGQ